MIRNFEYLIVFTSAPDVLPEQNDRYWIQPWKVNEIKAYKKDSGLVKVNSSLMKYSLSVVRHSIILSIPFDIIEYPYVI